MPKYKRQKFTICSAYDTETTNIGKGENTRAFPILFIDNDLRDRDLRDYNPDEDKIYLYRTEQEMLERIKEYILWGQIVERVPIICAYNLMFDLQPLMQSLDSMYDIRVNAQSSTNVYTVDLYELDTDNMLLRFWDTYHLEMRGLKAMGETAGLPKAVGDWDYSLIRTPKTKLTEEEKYYAGRDTQVIPMYLRYMLHSNEWLKQDDLGVRVLTKTSIVRQMARREIGTIFVTKKDGKKLSLDKAFIEKCKRQKPVSFGEYALRKACFRGGFTFTSARYAGCVMRNVASLDVTSMHHTFINGRYVPEDFGYIDNWMLQKICEEIVSTDRDYILENYERPFKYAIHARIKFKNLRIKKGSCFDKWGIALLSTSKFKREAKPGTDIGDDPRNVEQENVVKQLGWHDTMDNATIAFGKLYEAETCVLDVSELELWCVGQVYEWDAMIVILGEVTSMFRTPPDFVTLQSNELFDMKTKAKFISKHYHKGESYPYQLSGIPDGIAEELKNGTCDESFFSSWYTSTVKGMFNGIYGTMAQDVLKPSYKCEGGELVIDEQTRTTPENFDEKNAINSLRVLYTYGLRIVGGSRMHMIISMELLYEALGDRVKVLGGDTDSMKVSCDYDITDDDLDVALKPIAEASKHAIDVTMKRVRKNWPKFASSLTDIGSFDIENRGAHYDYHMELWNKCRVSYDGKMHVTCAGLRRPVNSVNIESIMTAFSKKYSLEKVMKECIGYNVIVQPNVSHALEHHKPAAKDTVDMDVTDWRGDTRHVRSHQSTALYPSARWLGDTMKLTNLTSVQYMEQKYHRKVETRNRYLDYADGKATLSVDSVVGNVVIMEVEL